MSEVIIPNHGIVDAPEWRSLEDAPRDGRRVWLLSERRLDYCRERVQRGYYFKNLARYDTWNQAWREDKTGETLHYGVRWQPVNDPPVPAWDGGTNDA